MKMSETDDNISPDEQLKLQAATANDAQTRLNVDSNRVFLAGTRRFPDFEESIERLKTAEVTSPDLLAQAMELDAPEKVLHYLGQEDNLDTAKKIAKLPPVRRAAALAALERGEPFVEKTVVPMWKRSRNDLSNESLSDREWSRAWDRKYLGKGR